MILRCNELGDSVGAGRLIALSRGLMILCCNGPEEIVGKTGGCFFRSVVGVSDSPLPWK